MQLQDRISEVRDHRHRRPEAAHYHFFWLRTGDGEPGDQDIIASADGEPGRNVGETNGWRSLSERVRRQEAGSGKEDDNRASASRRTEKTMAERLRAAKHRRHLRD